MKSILTTTLLLAVALGLTACGGDSGDGWMKPPLSSPNVVDRDGDGLVDAQDTAR